MGTALALVAGDKGLLAMDESNPTCNKRFARLGIPQTEEARRAWRELIVTTPGLGESISGAILYDETIRQHQRDGTSFVKAIADAGIIPGIKVDTGETDLAGHPGEQISEGLDGLRDRLAEYSQMGARFAKWRAVIALGEGLPSRGCIEANAQALARYASLCQEAGLVPVVEPEVLMDGAHALERYSDVTEEVLRAVFNQLYTQRVTLEGMILKPNMVLPGLGCSKGAAVEEVADATVGCLLRVVPAAVPGIAFLSGGQSAELASARLNAMNVRFKSRLPWALAFSFARAIQQPALERWSGRDANVKAAQEALLHRANCNRAARRGEYTPPWNGEEDDSERPRARAYSPRSTRRDRVVDLQPTHRAHRHPMTARGEDQARDLGRRLQHIPFVHVLTSSRQRARRTCELVGLGTAVELEPDLAEWDYGDYEGQRSLDIRKGRADWNIFRDGCPHGETPAQVSERADRLIAHLRTLDGNVALFSPGQFGGVLAARWIGLPIANAEHFPLGTASLSILEHDPQRPEVPLIALWNAASRELLVRPCRAVTSLQTTSPEGARLMKRLIVFDLDGTLAESKSSLDAEMAALLSALLRIAKVAVISGGAWSQFEAQVLSKLPHDDHLARLSLLPTCGTRFYQYQSGWKLLYAEDFNAEEKDKIIRSLQQVIDRSGFKAEKTWGEIIEDRGSQITFSGLGQQAPIEAKKNWDPSFTKRKMIKAALDSLIPEFSVRLGGTTSVDVTRPGIDKAYGIRKLRDILGIGIDEMIFIGDDLFPGGNDYPAKQAGVLSIHVRDPEESKRVIEAIAACLDGAQRVGTREVGSS